jgi:hypothetical protein
MSPPDAAAIVSRAKKLNAADKSGNIKNSELRILFFTKNYFDLGVKHPRYERLRSEPKGYSVNGLTTRTPVLTKSLEFRVTTVKS